MTGPRGRGRRRCDEFRDIRDSYLHKRTSLCVLTGYVRKFRVTVTSKRLRVADSTRRRDAAPKSADPPNRPISAAVAAPVDTWSESPIYQGDGHCGRDW